MRTSSNHPIQLIGLLALVTTACSPDPTGNSEPALPASSAAATAAVRTDAWPVTDLGTLPGGSFSAATDINAASTVVGYSAFAPTGDSHAFRWTQNGGMQDLGTLSPPQNLVQSAATAINDNGEVVGWSEMQVLGVVNPRAFYWSTATGMVELPSDPTVGAVAWDITSAGVIVGGGAVPGSSTNQVLRWTRTGAGAWTVTGLGVPASSAVAGGGIAGGNIVGGGSTNGFLYTGGAFKSLGAGTTAARIIGTRFVGAGGISAAGTGLPWEWPSLTAAPFSLGYLYAPAGSARDLNGANHVVGLTQGGVGSSGSGRAFYWDCPTGMSDLGSLAGQPGDDAAAAAINQHDVVAGVSNGHAVIWGVIPSPNDVHPLPFVANCTVPPIVSYIPKKFINDGIISRPGFNAALVDPNSVTIGDGFGHVTPIARAVAGGPSRFLLKDINGDGVTDMQVSFSTTDMINSGTLTRRSFQLVVSWVDATGLPGSGKYPIRVQ